MSSPTSLQATVVALSDVDRDLRASWAELERSAVEPNPFFGPEMLLPAARHLPGGQGVQLLVVQQGTELVLVMPAARGRHRRLPLTVATTWRHPYRYVGTPLVRPDALDSAPAVALRRLADLAPWAVLDDVYVDGPVAAAFRRAARRPGRSWVEYEVWDRPAVRSRPDDAADGPAVSARSAKTLRRQRRNLARDLGPVSSCDAARGSTAESLAAELDAFLELEGAGWKGRAGTAMASLDGHAAFFRESCTSLAAQDRLELWRLEAGKTVAARQCHVLAGGTVFHLKTTYDESLARLSPGVQLELDVLAAFHADERLQLLDPCTDNQPTVSERIYPDRRRLGVALVGLRPAGRVAAHVTPLAVRTWRAMRR